MRKIALVVVACLFSSAGWAQSSVAEVKQRLVGTWKVVSSQRKLKNGKKVFDPALGPRGIGFLIYSADGHMCAELIGEEPVDLDAFRTLPSSQATGAKNIGRLTNLMRLNVDLSWYTRYRSAKNPDFGVKLKGPFTIHNEPAIPLNDTDTPPDQAQPVPPATLQEARMQAIANTAGFHFAFIEQGGASLYPTLAFKATDPEVLRILVSIGGVEIDHFGLWHDKAGNAVAQPLAGVTDPETGLTFPDLNALNSELDQTNLILPEPCTFISKNLPECSVIRPTSTENGGAVATIKAFTDDLLFLGQSTAFFHLVNRLAVEADSVRGGF